MIIKTCVDCGRTFTLTDSELAFYQEKGLSEPKRCKACRDKKKTRKVGNSIEAKSPFWLVSAGVTSLLSYLSFQNEENIWLSFSFCFLALLFFSFGIFLLIDGHLAKRKAVSAEHLAAAQTLKNCYHFANVERLKEHYQKHAVETKAESPEDYVQKANVVIRNKKTRKKKEKEDGDDV